MRARSCTAIAALVALVLLAAAPAANARWGVTHGFDLGVRLDGKWSGFGLASRSADPWDFVVTRGVAWNDKVETLIRIRSLDHRGSATIRGCGDVNYIVDGVNVTGQVTDGGYMLRGFDDGHAAVGVIARYRASDYRCAIKVSSNGRVWDSMLLEIVSRRWGH